MLVAQKAEAVEATVRRAFGENGVSLASLDIRRYPGELIAVAEVASADIASARLAVRAADLQMQDQDLNAFVVVEVAKPRQARLSRVRNLDDPRVRHLRDLLTSRSRTSVAQPGLSYVQKHGMALPSHDIGVQLLVYGRRGTGKTAWMVEGKRAVCARGAYAFWANMQVYRDIPASRVFASVARSLVDEVLLSAISEGSERRLAELANSVYEQAGRLATAASDDIAQIAALKPELQRLTAGALRVSGRSLFLYFDDFHYIARGEQPLLLDLLHESIRSTPAWMRVATIHHLCRPFDRSKALGLQVGQDTREVDLDQTLQDVSEAQTFLEEILSAYTSHGGIDAPRHVFAPQALDRLVLASGAIPRDYLNLCALSIDVALQRENARLVGVQDVNKAAGQAATSKICELEEDAASSGDRASRILAALASIKRFCLQEGRSTAFLVDNATREQHADEYELLQELADLRLIHLLAVDVPDKRETDRRAEAYLLDISQYAVDKFRGKNQTILAFEGGSLVSVRVRADGRGERPHLRRKGQDKTIADSPERRLSILRSLPRLDIQVLGRPESGAPHCGS